MVGSRRSSLFKSSINRGRRGYAKMLEHNNMMYVRLLLVASVLVLGFARVGYTQSPFIVRMDPAGSDANDGLTADTPVVTLQRVQQILKSTLADNPRDAEVRIGPGTYRGQSIRWTFTMPEHTITFMPRSGDKVRPVFDGVENRGTWFRLDHSLGQQTGLNFHYIHVKRYATAISLNGNRTAVETCNRGNSIYGCMFSDVGEGSTAAVRLVNSKDNSIVNNHFVNITRSSRYGLLHAIYIAHHSSGNQILRNRFQDCCGDPVRVRDASNNNIVNENTFIRAGIAAAYSQWYCDHRRNDDDNPRNDCSKPTPECPSWNNQFRNNRLLKTCNGERLPAWAFAQDDVDSLCPPPSPGAKRLETSGNRHE